MRLTTLLLITVFMLITFSGRGQITLKEKNVPLEKVLTDIEKQSKYVFLYNPDDLKIGPISISVKNASLQQTLEKIFKDVPVEFSVVGNNVLLKKKQIARAELISEIIIRGRVVDSGGQPLLAVTVIDKRKNKGAETDSGGVFAIRGAKGDVLSFSFIGYQEKEVLIGDQRYIGDASGFLHVPLEPADGKLDEVQTIAYGKVTNRFNTGNVTTVKGSDLAMQPVGNALLALQGLVPGLAITQLSGAPGGGINVQLRGINTISSGSTPLYVIDGIPYDLRAEGALVYYNSNLVGGSLLNMINPADIESIDILKDADATAIYGSVGGNGVILISTLKGRPGPTRFTVDVYSGLGSATRIPQYLGLDSYLAMRHEALRNDSVAVASTDYDINGTWDTTRYTNWSKMIMGQIVHSNDLQLQLTGGNNNIQYFAGAGYHDETSVYPGDGGDKKGSVHMNINAATPDKKLDLRLNGMWLGGVNTVLAPSINPSTATAADAPPAYQPNDSLNWQNETFTNPLAPLTEEYNNHTHTLITSALLTYHVLRGLDLKVNVGYSNLYSREFDATPATTTDPWIFAYVNPSNYRYATYFHDNSWSWTVEPQASFTRPLARGVLTALAGGSYLHTLDKAGGFDGSGYPSDTALSDLSKATTVTPIPIQQDEYKYNALFGRLNYNWKNKYIANLNGRYDGSSRFGADRQFHFFGSLAGAWIFSAEPTVQRQLPWLSFGKLRASYGTSGNDLIPNYYAHGTYDTTLTAYQGSYGLAPVFPANPHISWETTRKMEIGLNLGFAKDRFLLDINYYRFRSTNLVLATQLSVVTGFYGVIQNRPAVVGNQGLELSGQTINIKTAHFGWTTSATLTIPRNKLVHLGKSDQTYYMGGLSVGSPVNIKEGFRSGGVDPQTGLYRFIDSSGKYTFNPSYASDQTSIVRLDPTLYGSLINRFQFGSFTLEILIFFNRQVNTNPNLVNVLPPGYEGSNVLNQTANARWRYPGQTTRVQRYSAGNDALNSYYNARASNLDYTNADFIRWKNLYLAYQFPAALTKKFHMSTFTCFIKGQNLFTVSPYKDYDPETGTNIAPVRLLAAGLKACL